MENPFEEISDRLDRIENQLQSIIDNNKPNDKPLPTFMSLKEVASFLHLSTATLYGYTSRRFIPFSKRGKRLFFDKKEIDAWILEGKQSSISDIEKMTDDFLSSRAHKYR